MHYENMVSPVEYLLTLLAYEWEISRCKPPLVCLLHPLRSSSTICKFEAWQEICWYSGSTKILPDEPCAGVTLSDVAVPDVCVPTVPWLPAARANAAVRNLFAFDILAT